MHLHVILVAPWIQTHILLQPMTEACSPAVVDDLQNFQASVFNSVMQLNEHLESYALPLLNIAADADVNSVASVVNCVHSLLLQKQRDIAYREDAANTLRRAKADNEALRQKCNKSTEALEKALRENAALKLKQQSAEQEQRRLRERLQQENVELGKLSTQLQFKQKELLHKVTRKEKECESLKDRVDKSMQDRRLGSATGVGQIDVLNEVCIIVCVYLCVCVCVCMFVCLSGYLFFSERRIYHHDSVVHL